MNLANPGITEVLCTRDAFGEIRVLDEGCMRVLRFGSEIDQSAIYLDAPHHLVFDYTQAMMLGLMFTPAPTRATLLGLGAGSIATALLHSLPGCEIVAVERRPLMVELAHRYFQLPSTARLRVAVQDAIGYVLGKPEPTDLLLVDLYDELGMDERQAGSEFLDACRAALRPGGTLVINLWRDDYEAMGIARQALTDVFGPRYVQCAVPPGNNIALAHGAALPAWSLNRFHAAALKLGAQMHIPLQRFAHNLWRQNPRLRRAARN